MISMITFGVGILHFVVTDHTKLNLGMFWLTHMKL